MAWHFWQDDEDVSQDCIPGPLCYRIWQERVLLGLSRDVVAQKLGLTLLRVKNIEVGRGKNPDTTTIGGLGVIGMDVSYILIGKRSKPPLKNDEAALLDNYRNSTPDNQAVLRKVGAALEKQIDDDGKMCA